MILEFWSYVDETGVTRDPRQAKQIYVSGHMLVSLEGDDWLLRMKT